jgi:CheY-like chemotaxis protein
LGGVEDVARTGGPREEARTFHPEVVVMDVDLPGIDGYELASRLRSDPGTADAVMIALTGYGQAEDRRRARVAS